MSRNLKPEYIKKLKDIKTENGFSVDLLNYIYNPSLDNEYPALKKITGETETHKEITRVGYFKHYDGNGEYYKEVYKQEKTGDTWTIATDRKETTLERSKRFNLNTLIEWAEAI